jgi:hypothetical protein
LPQHTAPIHHDVLDAQGTLAPVFKRGPVRKPLMIEGDYVGNLTRRYVASV